VLVLDEPTNHLDLWACESLEQAMREFEGTVIVVSHDRYFLNRVVDQLLVLEGNSRVQVIHGNYDTYELMRARQGSTNVAKSIPDETTPQREKPKPEREARKRKRRFPYRKVEELEADIAQGEIELRELERALASPDLYRDGERVKQATKAFEEIKVRL